LLLNVVVIYLRLYPILSYWWPFDENILIVNIFMKWNSWLIYFHFPRQYHIMYNVWRFSEQLKAILFIL